MQAEGFGWIGRGHELAVGLPLLIVQSGNRPLEVRHLFANLALGSPGGARRRLGQSASAGRRFAEALGLLALAFVDFFVDGIKISLVVATVVRYMTVANFNNAGGDTFHEVAAVPGEDCPALIPQPGLR